MPQRPWFGRKRYGLGLTPISWQGWVLTLGYAVAAIILGATLAEPQPWIFATVFAIVTVLFLLVAYLTRAR